VAAVFKEIAFMVETEIAEAEESDSAPDELDAVSTRQLVLDAYQEVMDQASAEDDEQMTMAPAQNQAAAASEDRQVHSIQDYEEEEDEGDEPFSPRDATCTSLAIWTRAIDILSERILWDEGYEDGDFYLDKPP
jgi:hypothetical protein